MQRGGGIGRRMLDNAYKIPGTSERSEMYHALICHGDGKRQAGERPVKEDRFSYNQPCSTKGNAPCRVQIPALSAYKRME